MSVLRSPLDSNSGFTFPEQSTTTTENNSSDISQISHSKFKYSKINTIDENLITDNQFEKSFSANLSLKKVNSRDTFNSDATLVDSLHNKNDSVNSINSTDTLNSFRLKRFNSASSIPSNLTSPESNNNYQLNSSSPNNNSFQLKKIAKFPIPDTLQLMTNTELSLILEGMTQLNDDLILILDVRPFIDFNSKHILKAINFNLPSTLLKRSNFTLTRCLNNLSITENLKINKFIEKPTNDFNEKKIIIYDDLNVLNNEISLASYGTANKFLNDSNFKGEIYILKNGFQSFANEFCTLTESSSSSSSSPPNIKPPHNRSLSLASVSLSSTPISPNLSRFQLPKLPKTPVFKIRHNEEFYDNYDNYKIINEFKFLNFAINNNDSLNFLLIPNWLKNSTNKNNYISLFEKFKILEIDEKKRINNLIATNNVTSGIELGFKNRYKDIFPYEHSRVKLSLTPTQEQEGYINANFINCPQLTQLKYIATQAPLKGTIEDFTKLVKDNDIKLIISLTNQFENGIEKCYPYWNDIENFKILESIQLNDFIIRRLNLLKYNKEVIQIQILNWSDFDIMLENQQIDVLKLIYLKKLILKNLNKQDENVIVHCSAGCGRTGTFCTLDSIINSNFDDYDQNKQSSSSSNNNFDPIFEIVENFRYQRISMVQNLRQYLFIYDCLLNYFENFQDFKNNGFKKLNDLEILKNFINKDDFK